MTGAVVGDTAVMGMQVRAYSLPLSVRSFLRRACCVGVIFVVDDAVMVLVMTVICFWNRWRCRSSA